MGLLIGLYNRAGISRREVLPGWPLQGEATEMPRRPITVSKRQQNFKNTVRILIRQAPLNPSIKTRR
jgi:hypothetical protein